MCARVGVLVAVDARDGDAALRWRPIRGPGCAAAPRPAPAPRAARAAAYPQCVCVSRGWRNKHEKKKTIWSRVGRRVASPGPCLQPARDSTEHCAPPPATRPAARRTTRHAARRHTHRAAHSQTRRTRERPFAVRACASRRAFSSTRPTAEPDRKGDVHTDSDTAHRQGSRSGARLALGAARLGCRTFSRPPRPRRRFSLRGVTQSRMIVKHRAESLSSSDATTHTRATRVQVSGRHGSAPPPAATPHARDPLEQP